MKLKEENRLFCVHKTKMGGNEHNRFKKGCPILWCAADEYMQSTESLGLMNERKKERDKCVSEGMMYVILSADNKSTRHEFGEKLCNILNKCNPGIKT